MNLSKFNAAASVVLTSIAAPNSVMRELAAQSKQRGMSFYVMGDVPSPAGFSLDGCDFYSLDRQRATGFKLAPLLPTRHYARKNVGYLLAIQSHSSMLLETDDDNTPLPGFWDEKPRMQRVRALSGFGWTNVYAYFSEANIWPRGLPLDAVQAKLPLFTSLPEIDADCPIQQGLADENPDVDAIYRLLLPLPISFLKERQIALGAGSWCPFNSQNTRWFPEAYPLLYLPSYCSFRMTDIWRSFVAQRIAWENDWSLLFTSSDVVQDRNDHNLMRDFADEVSGYLNNRKIGEQLAGLKLEPGAGNLGANLIRCYEELIRTGIMPAEELELVKAWVEDVQALL